MIYDAATFPLPARLKADLCVVGCGAGGSMVAKVAAEAGLSVLVLEPGAFLTPGDMNQREEQMFKRLLWAAGGRTTVDMAVKIHQGMGVGGSTLHNTALCKRIPRPILDEWRETHGLEHLPLERWDALYTEVEALLGVRDIPEREWNPHNRLLQKACEELRWRGGPLRDNRKGCTGSGYCEVGCSYDGKNNAAKRLIPAAVAAGAEVVTHAQAVVVTHRGGEVTGVEAVALDPVTREPLGRLTVEARRVCLSASATGTPAVLLRSDVPDPSETTGRTLRIHPALVAAGEFDVPVDAWRGIPQTYECTQFLEFGPGATHRTWIVPAFAHPMGFATMLPGHGTTHRDIMRSYRHLGVLTGMLHDHTTGRVEPRGDLGVAIDYWPSAEDRDELMFGLAACARMLFAAGARRVMVPSHPEPLRVHQPEDSWELANLGLGPGVFDVTAVHPMSSVAMHDDPARGAVDSRGKHHHLGGLWVADGSLFPTSIGGPPQLSIYTLGLHVGRAIAQAGDA